MNPFSRIKRLTSNNKLYLWMLWLRDSSLDVLVLSLILSLLFVSILAVIFGVEPWAVLIALFEGGLGGRHAIASTIKETVPLALAGLAVFIPFKASFFNIGGQGQLQVGALAAMVVVLNIHAPGFVVVILALLAAMAAGAISILIPLVLKIKRNASEVTTTIMMNFACINLVYAMITGAMKDPDAWYGTTLPVPMEYRLPEFTLGINFHLGILIALVCVIAAYWIIKNTTYGMAISAAGFNPGAAEAAGFSVKKTIIGVVLVGALIAGLAGGIQVLGVTFRVAEAWAKDWGFTGIAIAFLAGNSALAIIPISFIFAILEVGARHMQAMTGAPAALIYVFKGLPVLIFVALRSRRLLMTKRID